MSFIGEAALSASVELLIEKLASQGLELFRRNEKLKAGFIRWKGMLEMIQAVLADAEERQTREKSVKIWLRNLQNLAYDVEDVLDEFETEALRRESLLQEPAAAGQPSGSRSFTDSLNWMLTPIRKLFTSDSPPSSFNFESKMVSKIEELTARLQDIISTQKDLLKMKNVISTRKEVEVHL